MWETHWALGRLNYYSSASYGYNLFEVRVMIVRGELLLSEQVTSTRIFEVEPAFSWKIAILLAAL